MAKGKSFLGLKKGQAGGLVYSVGRDGNGKRQQVVRALAEQVSNPQTYAQSLQRSYLGGASRLAAIFGKISDHAYEGIPAGQANRSAFIRGILDFTTAENDRPYSIKGVPGVFVSKDVQWGFPISKGTLPAITALNVKGEAAETAVWTPAILAQLGLQENDILTFVDTPIYVTNGGFVRTAFVQVVVKSSGNIVNAETGEAVSLYYSGSLAGNDRLIGVSVIPAVAVIHERKTENGYKRSNATYTFTSIKWGPNNSPANWNTPQGAAESYMPSGNSVPAVKGADYLDGSNANYPANA